mgnify:CR=1 FL=1|jgi:hypothetical protein
MITVVNSKITIYMPHFQFMETLTYKLRVRLAEIGFQYLASRSMF